MSDTVVTVLLIAAIVLAVLVLVNVALLKEWQHKRKVWKDIEARWEKVSNNTALTPERVAMLLDLYYINIPEHEMDEYLIEQGLVSEDGLTLTSKGRGLVANLNEWSQQNKKLGKEWRP